MLRPRTRHYILNYLDIWHDLTHNYRGYIDPTKTVALQKELVELGLASRVWLQAQADLNNPCPIEVRLGNETIVISPGIVSRYDKQVKSGYEHGGFAVVEDSLITIDNPLYAKLKQWYNAGKMFNFTEMWKFKSLRKKEETLVDIQARREEKKETQLAAWLSPLEIKINNYKQFNVFTLSLINLKHRLTAAFVQNNDIPTAYQNIPRQIETMTNILLNPEITPAERLQAIATCTNNLNNVLNNGNCQIKTALAFVLTAAFCLVAAIYLAPVFGIAASFFGMHTFATGVGITVISSIISSCVFWRHQHDGIRDALHQVFDAAKHAQPQQKIV